MTEYERQCELAEDVGSATNRLNAAIEAIARTGIRVIVTINESRTEGMVGQAFIGTLCAVPVPP